jgi:hypothetical protein
MSNDHEKQPAPVFFTCGPHDTCPQKERCVIAERCLAMDAIRKANMNGVERDTA